MKPRRIILILAPFLCVMLYIAFEASIRTDVPHSSSTGERLLFASLAPNEEVIVSKLFAHRNVLARQYRFRRDGQRSEVAVFDASVTWTGNTAELAPTKLLVIRDLTRKEAEGLDETAAYFREVRDELSSATRHYRLIYFRDGKKIGEEFYIGFSLPDQIAYFDREGFRGNPDYASDYARLAEQYHVSVERMDRMVPFEVLEKVAPKL